MKRSFTIFNDSLDLLNELTDEQAGKLFRAIKDFNLGNDPVITDPLIRVAFAPFKAQFIRDGIGKTPQEISDINSKNRKLRKPTKLTKGNENNESNELVYKSDSVCDSDSDSKKGGKGGKQIFTPPTLEDVIAFSKEKGFPEEIAKKAFEYYSLADWHDSKGNKVKNWKQKINTVWFTDENKGKPELNLAPQKKMSHFEMYNPANSPYTKK